MSLIAWYPLLGNENNQGLDGTNLEVMGTVPYNAGKIGNAATFSGVAANCLHRPSFNLTDNFTWACWVKITNTVSTYQFILSEGRDYEKYGMSLITFTNGSIGLMYGTNSTLVILSSPVLNTWYHITVVVSSTEGIKGYVNGALAVTGSYKVPDYTYSSNRFTIGKMSYTYTNTTSYFPLNGQVNDVRIYNHCLSAKEVKEISKGLVLHFPMRDEYIENTTNISSQTSKGGWDNSGAAVRETNNADLIKTAPYPDNVYSIKVTAAGNCALTFGTTTINVPSKTLTCSVYCYLSGTQENNSVYIRSTESDGSLGAFEYNGTTNTTQWPKDRWIRLEKTITLASSETTIYFCTYANSLNNIRAFSGWQIEEKDHATPFTKNSRNDSIAYDCSGYGHNGQKEGNIICSSNTPKNEVCYYFNGTTVDNSSNTLTGAVYITAGLPLPASSALTVSWWGKITKYARGGIFETTSATSDYVNGTDYNTTAFANWDTTFGVYNGSTRINLYSDMGIPNSSWQLNTITFDGTNVKYYKNGSLISTNALSGTLPAFNGIKIGIGKAGGVYRQIQQYVSDFRIYTTALSVDDVKELYQIPISVDKSGNAFAMEFVEDQKPEFHKNGIVEALDFYENLIFHDMEFKTLSDGSLWARILHHNNKGGTVLFTKDNAINYQSTDLYSRLYALEGYRDVDGKFEFMAIQPDLDANKIYRWKQSSNPIIDSTIAGYENITNGQGGLVKCSGATYCAVSSSSNNWWCAVGCYTAYQGGIPGFGSNVVTGTLDLYVRISSLDKAGIYKKNYIVANQILEV